MQSTDPKPLGHHQSPRTQPLCLAAERRLSPCSLRPFQLDLLHAEHMQCSSSPPLPQATWRADPEGLQEAQGRAPRELLTVLDHSNVDRGRAGHPRQGSLFSHGAQERQRAAKPCLLACLHLLQRAWEEKAPPRYKDWQTSHVRLQQSQHLALHSCLCWDWLPKCQLLLARPISAGLPSRCNS